MKNILVMLLLLGLAGCATSARYVPYTDRKLPAKRQFDSLAIYPQNSPPIAQPYAVLGRIEVEGYASDGVTPDTLTDRARVIARKRGGDAIINAKTEVVQYEGAYVTPGYVGRRHYHPGYVVPYSNDLLRFRGELVQFVSGRSAR